MNPIRLREQSLYYENLQLKKEKRTLDEYLAIKAITQLETDTINAAKEYTLAKLSGHTERLPELYTVVDKLAKKLSTACL